MKIHLWSALGVAVVAASRVCTGDAAAPKIPVEPYQPLAGVQSPAEIPEKSRVLSHEEIWELPDTMRREVQGQFITINYEQTRIVHEVIIAGKDAGEIGTWQELYDDENQRMIVIDGEIRPPGGTRVPLDPKVNLLEKVTLSPEQDGKKAAAEGPPRKRLWWVIVPGISPGTIIDIRSIMHYDTLPWISKGFVDGPLAVDHYRLRVRSNKKLYLRRPGFWTSFMGGSASKDKLKFTGSKDADFNPRGVRGIWFTKAERWWADILLLPRGTTLRRGAERDSPDCHESELLAENIPAHQHEVVQPSDQIIRPLALAYYSTTAPSQNMEYWEKNRTGFHQEALRKFLHASPSQKEFDPAQALGAEPGEARVAHLAAWLQKKFTAVPDDKLRSYRDTVRTLRGPWYAAYYLMAKILRDAGMKNDLALVFNRDDLPVVPELTDDHFYAGPFLAVRVETAAGVEYYFPTEDDFLGGHAPPWNRGAAAYVFWADAPARRDTVPDRAPSDDAELFTLKGALSADGALRADITGVFTGFTAQRIRKQLKNDVPLVIEIKPEEMDHMDEIIRQRHEAVGEMNSVSVQEYLKMRFGGVATTGKSQSYGKPGSPATLSGSIMEDSYAAGMMPLLVENLNLEPLFSKTERRYPVRDSLPESHRFEFDLALPAGKMPSLKALDETIEGPGGFRFTAQAKFRGGHWAGAWSLVETWGEVAPADYPKLRAAEEKAQELLTRKIPLVAAR